MKILIFVLLVVCTKSTSSAKTNVGLGKTASQPIPFSVACSGVKADVLIPNNYTLGNRSNCEPILKNGSSGHNNNHYELNANCLSRNGTFYVFQVEHNITTDGHIYKVICDDKDGRVVKVNVSIGVGLPTGEATVDKVTSIPPDNDLKLYLLKTMPSRMTGAVGTDFNGHIANTALLGEPLFLSLVKDSNSTISGVLDLIPLQCNATASGTTSTANLWQLHSIDDSKKCFFENAVVKSPFSRNLTSDGAHRLYSAQIEAFKLAGSQSSTISISCSVRVCTTKATSGACHDDKDVLDACPLAASARRRRREVEDAATPHGSVHHVTATFRVVDDVMAHDGSTAATYTLPCLLLSVLAKLIL